MQLSKSDYMLYLKHPAWLWVKKNDPTKIPPVDANTQVLFDSGNQFEQYGESLFEGGITIGFDFADKNKSYATMPSRTQDAIEAGNKVLFQPRFEWNGFTCISDILVINKNGSVDLYEIKGSTSAKTIHELDLAFQVAVLQGTGLSIRNVFVIHVNNKYIRSGEIEADKITTVTNVTTKVKALSAETVINMEAAKQVAGQTEMPDPAPHLAKLGSKKDWLKIYDNLVSKPPETTTGEPKRVINAGELKNYLKNLVYPLYFLDYETMMSLVPYFDGHRPYQQIPFQYSLHILKLPTAELEHKEYLHRDNSDPSLPLAKQLIVDIGEEGSVIVWYEGFEKARNNELGELHPEIKQDMQAINDRVVDLMVPFKEKWYSDSRFDGSSSIKNVLPVLCPELSYKELGIQEGASAQRLWMEAVLDGKHPAQKEQILSDLTEYCKLDTLAMVEIYKKLTKI